MKPAFQTPVVVLSCALAVKDVVKMLLCAGVGHRRKEGGRDKDGGGGVPL